MHFLKEYIIVMYLNNFFNKVWLLADRIIESANDFIGDSFAFI